MVERRRLILALAAIMAVAAGSYYFLTIPRSSTLREESEHFQFFFDGLSDAPIRPIAGALEENHDRVISDLGVASMPVVRVKVWRSTEGFYDEMVRLLGVRYSGADGYVYGGEELHVRLVNDAPIKAVHEFAHVVSLNLNPTFSNNPRWLWEAVALYEAGQFVPPSRLNYMARGDYPSIQELNSDFGTGGNKIYSVGYVLAEYIIEGWGMDALRELITTNGDVSAVLGMSVDELQQGWHRWIEARYLS
jgi:hypothetical protein